MRRLLAVLLLTAPLLGAKKAPAYQYQDAILLSFRDVAVGSSCSTEGTTNGTVDDDGRIKGDSSGSSSCHNQTSRQYTVKLGDSVYVLQAKAPLTSTIPVLWMIPPRESVLARVMPGTPLKVRMDGGTFYVKVGSKESAFNIVAAQ